MVSDIYKTGTESKNIYPKLLEVHNGKEKTKIESETQFFF